MRKLCLAMAMAGMLASGLAQAQSTLRIGLQDDPDVLDPVRARTFVGRIVFASLCDKLVEITPDLKIVPRLAILDDQPRPQSADVQAAYRRRVP